MENRPTTTPLSAIKPLLAAFLLTGLVIHCYQYIPKRELVLIPGNDPITSYLDTTGTSQFQWLNENNRSFRCTYNRPATRYKFCGLDVRQGDGIANGVDLSIYDEMNVQIKYTGESEIIRLFMRNFSPEFSDINNAQDTSKYLRILIPVNDLRESMVIKVRDLAIPSWWILATEIPRSLSTPDINNIVHLGLDVPYPTPFGAHDLELKSLRLTGVYISRGDWYLLILSTWGVLLFIIAIKRDIAFQQKAKLSTQKLAKERVKSKLLKRVGEKYKELSMLDTLTGVFNRRGIYQFYDKCFTKAPLAKGAIIMLDIDHFKPVNDTYGHDIGDSVLHGMGKILRNSVRNHDTVGRWGGEEFIILCVNTDMNGAVFLAEKIRREVEEHTFDTSPTLSITISLGVGLIKPGARLEDCVKLTDLAMYKAKQSGRNRWVATGKSQHEPL